MIQRIRTIKPELARHEALFDIEQELKMPVRFAWVMLFTVCDKEGRFKWRPRAIKTLILPYDKCDFEKLLEALVRRGLAVKYSVGGEEFGCIPTFTRHQRISGNEAMSDSLLPAPPDGSLSLPQCFPAASAVLQEGKGKEGNGTEEERKGTEGDGATASAAPPAAAVAFLGLIDGTKFEVTQAMVDEWVALYPAVDVMQQLRNMYGWLEGNKENRKTRTGVMRFIHRWLGKEQNSARAHSSSKASQRQRAISAAAEGLD